MATRRINFEDRDVRQGQTIAEIVPQNATQIVAHKPDGAIEVMTLEEAKRRLATDYNNVTTNQADVIRGSVKSRLLFEDLKLFHKYFLSDFTGIKTTIDLGGDDLDNDPEYICINKFPLPDYFVDKTGRRRSYNPDYLDLIVIIADYPDNGPFGIHVRASDPNVENIKKALDGHQFTEPIGHPDSDYQTSVEELKNFGWIWQCFHYRNARWKINPNNLRSGDCLAKYLDNLYAAFSGALHPAS